MGMENNSESYWTLSKENPVHINETIILQPSIYLEGLYLGGTLGPGKFEWNFRYVIFQRILVIDGWGICCSIALIWMPVDFTDDQSTLVQLMAWCRQARFYLVSFNSIPVYANQLWSFYQWDLFCQMESTIIISWMSNYIHYKVWDEVTYSFPNFSGAAVEVWDWKRNFIVHFTGHMITYYPWD